MNTQDDVALAHRLLNIINIYWMSQATYVAACLGIADLLANGPRTCEDLAAATDTHAPALRRLLRALSTLDLCTERDNGIFEITPMGSLLAADAPCSVRSVALQSGGAAWPVWANLTYSIKTGTSARALITGTPGFAHLEKDPSVAAIFNMSMVELTRLVAMDVARGYDFSGKRVVDIGGGYGELLVQILSTYGDATGVLFDMPHAIAKARDHFAARGLNERCEFVVGDFFESVPSDADIYVLKSVIHDWNDVQGRAILETCRRAMRPCARLLLVERLMPERLEQTPEHQVLARSDLHMLVALGAQERTTAQFDALLKSAGLKCLRTIETTSAFHLIEAEAGTPFMGR